MSAPVLVKTLRDQKRSLVGWSVGIAVLLLVEGALWPSVRDMPQLDEMLEGYPEAMKEMFDLDTMSTGVGFLNAELFTLVLPALFIVYGISRGARLVAGEEEAGTLEIVLVTPVSTTRILLEKAAGLVASMLLLGLVCALATTAVAWAFDMGVPVGHVLAASLAMVLIGTEYGVLALAIGAVTGRRMVAIAVSGAAAVAAYVLYVAGMLVEGVADWMPLSPFHQALAGGPLAGGLPGDFAWLVLGAAAVLAVAPPAFARRDIRHP
jgi:ABC-2 type transport system permease protein